MSRGPGHCLRTSWVAVALIPVAFILAMLVGEGLLSLQGYDAAALAIPVGVVLAAAVPALLILVAPGLAALIYGRRAYRAGRPGGAVSASIGGVAAAVALMLNVLPLIINRVT